MGESGAFYIIYICRAKCHGHACVVILIVVFGVVIPLPGGAGHCGTCTKRRGRWIQHFHHHNNNNDLHPYHGICIVIIRPLYQAVLIIIVIIVTILAKTITKSGRIIIESTKGVEYTHYHRSCCLNNDHSPPRITIQKMTAPPRRSKWRL